MSDPIRSARLDALKMLARRELSEAQIRRRLARRGHDAGAIDAAVAKLHDERAIDDARVAEAIARTEVTVRRRGKLRVRRRIENAGIAASIARRAVDDVFGEVDAEELLEASLAKRLHGRPCVADDAEFARLYRYLVGQGFEADRVVEALNKRKGRRE